jgi:hypothetical protein
VRRLALLAVLAAPPAAHAADGESALSVSADFASLIVDQGTTTRPNEKSGVGGLIGIDYQRGFGDSFWLRGGLGAGALGVNGQAGYAAVGTVGLTYAVDVLKYVPYVGIGAGGVLVGGGALNTHVDPVIDLAAGIEVQQSPSFSFSVEGRFESVWAKTTLFIIGPRASFKWGYF